MSTRFWIRDLLASRSPHVRRRHRARLRLTLEALEDRAARAVLNGPAGLVIFTTRPEAERQYRNALAIVQGLAARSPAVLEHRQDLAAAHNNLGNLLVRRGNWPEAERQYRIALAVVRRLAADFPGVPAYRQDLASCHHNLGLLLLGLTRGPEAERHFLEALAVQEGLAAASPAVPEYQIELGGRCCHFGGLLSDGGRPDVALVWLDRAVRTLTAAYERDRQQVAARQLLRDSHACRAVTRSRLGRHAEAVRDWDRAIDLSPEAERSWLRAERAWPRLEAGQVDQAVADVAELTRSSGWAAGQFYNFACVYALASARSADKVKEYADLAMWFLWKAMGAGFADAAHAAKDE